MAWGPGVALRGQYAADGGFVLRVPRPDAASAATHPCMLGTLPDALDVWRVPRGEGRGAAGGEKAAAAAAAAGKGGFGGAKGKAKKKPAKKKKR